MKRFVWIIVAATALTAGAFAQRGGTSPAKPKEDTKTAETPRIKFDSVVYDFGTTSMVQEVKGAFTFQNVGTGVLEVLRPNVSCGCTVAAVNPPRVGPGEKGTLEFTLNLTGIGRGHVEKTIAVPCNDVQNPVVTLTVKVNLFSIYDVAPTQVSLGDVRVGTKTRGGLMIRRTDGQPLTLGPIEGSMAGLTAELEPLPSGDPKAGRVVVTLDASGEPRRINERVVLVDDKGQQIAAIPVFARIVGDLMLSQELIFWGVTDPDNWPGAFPELMARRVVSVKATASDRVFNVKNPSSTLRDMDLSVVTVETGKVYEIVARLNKAPRETERGLITFETDVPSQPVMTIPVTINVLKRAGQP